MALSRKQHAVISIVSAVACIIAVAVVLIVTQRKKKDDDVSDNAATVDCDCGTVRGKRVQVDTKDGQVASYEFLNIPYAEKPKRWSFPVLRSSLNRNCWKGEYQANQSNILCMQRKKEKNGNYTYYGSEDCLYLSVRSPNLKGRLPVLVWIHGGNLLFGWNEMRGYSIDSEFAVNMNVVGVNVNYRLNVFGFLTVKELWRTTRPESYGNYGFADQITALKWVQANIEKFGGDPTSVTIMGESSGGSSVIALLSSPLANGLFHRAIPMSGSPVWRYNASEAAALNDVVLDTSGCRDRGTKFDRRRCLLDQSSREALANGPWFNGSHWDEDYTNGIYGQLPLPGVFAGPIASLDPVIFTSAPVDLQDVKFTVPKPVQILIGNTAQELQMYEQNRFENWTALREYTKHRMDLFNTSFFDKIWFDLYKNSSDVDNITGTPQFVYETMATDVEVTCPTSYLAERYSASKQHTVYRYYVEHRPSMGVRSATHMWDTIALFDFKQFSKSMFKPSAHDYMFMREIRRVIKLFVHEGRLPDGWRPVPEGVGIFSNEAPGVRYDKKARDKQCKFWNDNGFFKYGWGN